MPTTTTRPFRFGVQANGAPSGRDWLDFARRCESLGYSTLTMPDHFGDQFAPVPALAAAAAATTTLRVGAMVFGNDYRHPAVLAKELATMDVLSDGRVEIGIGAGWMLTDYEQLGIAYDRPGVRVDRFVEAVKIIKSCMAGTAFSFSGQHYRITDYAATPLPVQPGGPPLVIGGGGNRVLRIAAEQADIVGVNASLHAGAIGPEALATMTAPVVDTRVDLVRDAAGARFADIELSVRTFMVNVTEDRDATRDAIGSMVGMDAATIAASPFALIGNPAQLIEDLLARRERWGFSYIVVGQNDIDVLAPVVAELAGR